MTERCHARLAPQPTPSNRLWFTTCPRRPFVGPLFDAAAMDASTREIIGYVRDALIIVIAAGWYALLNPDAVDAFLDWAVDVFMDWMIGRP